MSKKVETFIFVHDQQIVIDFENNNKLKNLSSYKYVFLGNRDIDKIVDYPNVIFARFYEDNIERYNKKLLAFTGWYLIWKNQLTDADFVNLLEYDVILSDDFEKVQNEMLSQSDISFMGYQLINVKEHWYVGEKSCSEALIKSIEKNYNVKYYDMVDSMPANLAVTITSNHSFDTKHFDNYMKWMEPMIEDIKDEDMAGHMPERSVSMYYLIHRIPGISCNTNILKHYRLDSHETQGQSKDYKEESYLKIIKN